MAYLGLFFAGMLLANALPHLMTGVQGERFFTPWARPRGVGRSSAVENVLWGLANLALGSFLIDRLFWQPIPHGTLAIAGGFAFMAIGLALIFARRQALNG